MQYLLMLYSDESRWNTLAEKEREERTAAYVAYAEALAQAGALVGGERLHPVSAATRVTVKDGRPQVLDGPYADSKEQLGGYFLIEAPDLDAALAWTARCPGVHDGIVEVRPIWPID